jgi:NitT/TauT family transport system substrate-binding protein
VVAQYVAESFLREEGFETVEYVPISKIADVGWKTASGEVDFAMNFAATAVVTIDQDPRLSVLAGMHVGCFELVARDEIPSVGDLRGRRVAVTQVGSDAADYNFIAGIFRHVGIDVNHDVQFVEGTAAESIARLQTGDVDAFLAFPPFTQELRAKQIGHVVLSSIEDEPWSNYFCCLVQGNKRFIDEHPKAAKRVVRAYIRAAEHCAEHREEVADFLVERGYMNNRDYAGEMMRTLPYDVWRRYDPEDTLRFYALRLRESGIVEKNAEKILEEGTDWRFVNELKKELAHRPAPWQPADSAFALNCEFQTEVAATREPGGRRTG